MFITKDVIKINFKTYVYASGTNMQISHFYINSRFYVTVMCYIVYINSRFYVTVMIYIVYY